MAQEMSACLLPFYLPLDKHFKNSWPGRLESPCSQPRQEVPGRCNMVQHGTKLSHLGSRSSGWSVPIKKKGLWGFCPHLIVEFPLHSGFQTPVPVGNESDWPSQEYAWCE